MTGVQTCALPICTVRTYKTFYMPDTQDQFDFTAFDYVVDAIDTVKGKLTLVEAARAAGTPIICSMGAGNKTDPAAFAWRISTRPPSVRWPGSCAQSAGSAASAI